MDYVVLIMTGSICLILLGVQIRYTVSGMELPEEKGRILENIVITMLAIVSIYVGAKIDKGDDE